MIHLFKHNDGKFDFAIVRKGNYIDGSSQHYERRSKVISAIRANMKHDYNSLFLYLQDDTNDKSVIVRLTHNDMVSYTSMKTSKKYTPKSNSKKK
jgi:hypothetical protein